MLGLPSLNLLTASSQLGSKLSEKTNDRLVDEPVAHENTGGLCITTHLSPLCNIFVGGYA